MGYPGSFRRFVEGEAFPEFKGGADAPQQPAALDAPHAVAKRTPPPHSRPHEATPRLEAVLLEPPLVLRRQDLDQHCREQSVPCSASTCLSPIAANAGTVNPDGRAAILQVNAASMLGPARPSLQASARLVCKTPTWS